MRILYYELLLAARRWYRRPTQAVLLTVTFALSITLAVVSWSLFHTVFLKNAEFDPEGTLLLVSQGGPKAPRRYVGYGKHPAATREDVRAWESAQTVFSDFAAVGLYRTTFLTAPEGSELLQDQRSEGGAFFAATTPGIFEVLEVPLLEGETVTEKIGAPDQPAEAVVNASLASRLWPGQSAIGRILYARYGTSNQVWSVRIVGVARDFQASGPKATNNDFIICNYAGWFPISGFLYARGTTVPPSVTEVTEVVRRADPRVSSYFGTTLQEVIDRELGSVRLTARLTVVYALAAMVLCAIGVYSVTVSSLLQRSREFGIRLALGMDAVRLWRRFARSHLLLAAAGVLVGMVGAALVAPVLRASLYGVPTRDPMTYLVAALLILSVAGAACLPSLPRLRRISPAECMRSL
jgi:hypothetical protein